MGRYGWYVGWMMQNVSKHKIVGQADSLRCQSPEVSGFQHLGTLRTNHMTLASLVRILLMLCAIILFKTVHAQINHHTYKCQRIMQKHMYIVHIYIYLYKRTCHIIQLHTVYLFIYRWPMALFPICPGSKSFVVTWHPMVFSRWSVVPGSHFEVAAREGCSRACRPAGSRHWIVIPMEIIPWFGWNMWNDVKRCKMKWWNEICVQSNVLSRLLSICDFKHNSCTIIYMQLSHLSNQGWIFSFAGTFRAGTGSATENSSTLWLRCYKGRWCWEHHLG